MYGIIINEKIQLWKIGLVCILKEIKNSDFYEIHIPFIDKPVERRLIRDRSACIKFIDRKWFNILLSRNKYIAKWKKVVDK
jgi:hypothetical protein